MPANGGIFEFQRLHGMGEALYDQVVNPQGRNIPCRIYAPIGHHEDLLAYLVRRLLENGSNTSFVNRIVDRDAPIADIIADPIAKVAKLTRIPHPRIPLPRHIYGATRLNSKGIDLSDQGALQTLAAAMADADRQHWRAAPLIGGKLHGGEGKEVFAPSDRRRCIGTVAEASVDEVGKALGVASRAAPAWANTPAEQRAACLDRAADLLEAEIPTLLALCAQEGGKTITDGVAEVREAVDFCRYYAERARLDFAAPQNLIGPTGERDQLRWHGRGCSSASAPGISRWRFSWARSRPPW
ncbi:MAG: proline dehydrogenase family protein [Candidatus Competibacteraceae bacterium]